MIIGLPKEIKNNEFRVGMTPGNVSDYVQAGHTVLVEAVQVLALISLIRNMQKLVHRF